MPEVQTETVQISVNGETLSAFLARPEGAGPFPGVVVIQEWWGLEDHIKDVTQRYAREGFLALAPDLYHGKLANEPSEAQKLMMALDMNRASKELLKAADYLAQHPLTRGRKIGATGFCMGGGLALTLACDSPHIQAVAPYYGINPNPIDKVANIRGPVLAVYAEHDNFSTAEVREQLKEALTRHGKQFQVQVYPGTQHAFFNDSRPQVYNRDAASDAWQKTLSLFKENL
ncbi:MAG TPA: dienelactone hydrolase family protein [Dehalococcoidia bacterium]|nr:dienelactone hydrolase family protein [Dehalococcoidia bacterium]